MSACTPASRLALASALSTVERSVSARARTRQPTGQASDRRPRASTRGEAASLGAVYREHADFVWRVARRLGVSEAALEDVVHDVFLIVHRRLAEYDGRAAMTTWLFHITRGVVSNRRRGERRSDRRRQGFEIQARAQGQASASPEIHSERLRAARFVRDFLDGLDAERRALFELVEVDGLKVAEAARHLKINHNTAHSRLRSARAAFRAAVAARLKTRGDADGGGRHA